MLSKKTLASIAALTKVKVEDIETAIADTKEVDLTLEDGLQTFTPAELTTRDTQTKEAAKNGHIQAGKEIAIKDLKEATGIEFAGKDPAKFIEEYKNKVIAEAKLPVDTKVTELNTQITTLRQTISQGEATASQLKAEAEAARLDARILGSLPANRNKDLSDGDYLLLVKSRLKVETVDGKEVIKDAKGEVLRDKTAVPKDLATVLTETFAATPSWVTKADPKGGRGGGNSNPDPGAGGKPTSYKEAEKEWIESGKSINSADFSTYVSTLAKENTAFDMEIGESPAATT